jgi:hypothetical protein
MISSPPQHNNLGTLLAACGASSAAAPPPPLSWERWRAVADHLLRFAGIELPHPSQRREAMLISDEWDDLELGIAVGSILVWYHWSTTA